jgi:Cu+-exporting ATPase
MLVGRVVQERTYKSISFHRDYKSYFPIAVTVVTEQGNVNRNLQDLKEKDVVLLHNDEIIPADAVLVKGKASIDYSFVTGESEPVQIKEGSLLYAGGKQVGEQITIQVVKPVAGSYLTSLWNHFAFTKDKIENNYRDSIIHKMSIYFTYLLLALSALVALYWWRANPAMILPSVSAMLIVACPCALLLAVTYTNGNLLRIFSNNGLFLRDATIIEQIGKINHIVFDKTGTLTQGGSNFHTTGHQLDEVERSMLFSVVKSSTHPYSKALATYLGSRQTFDVNNWKEYPGQGVVAEVNGKIVRVGSAGFLGLEMNQNEQASVYVKIGEHTTAFTIVPDFREEIRSVIPKLNEQYELSLISGDNDRQKKHLQQIFTPQSHLLFEQKPIDKLQYIERLQNKQQHVMMVGDGLNDAGALQQSNVGITLADDVNNFTPSCDAILDAKRFAFLPGLLRLAKAGKYIINTSFVVSILYNCVGLTISMQGKMSPMIAAILMPISTLSIVLISTGLSSLIAKRFGLSLLKEE